MCGIVGYYSSNPQSHVCQQLVDALTLLQHRGQDAAGICTTQMHNNRFNLVKELGTVSDVFTQNNITRLQGNVGIGHVRYPTAGGSCADEAQPFYTNYPFGIALAHNGNLTNTSELQNQLNRVHRHVNTSSDSEVLLNIFADELSRRPINNISADDIFDCVRIVMRKCKGAYAVVILISNIGLLAFRDPNGIRPLCFGRKKNSTTHKYDYIVASESVAVDALDVEFNLLRDVSPGESIFINMHTGEFSSRQANMVDCQFTPCLFEHVYFARPDSIMDGVPVHEARWKMGVKLADKIIREYSQSTDGDGDNGASISDLIDVVMPIPETSRTAALACAGRLKKPYIEGFIKNRYIARTFIMPGQEMRRKTVRLKLNTIKSEFKGKNVLLIDDSIVRGTTSVELIQMARDAGARRVFFASAGPPVKYSNVYGIDIPSRHELVAHNRSMEEIQQLLGADLVIYNDLEDCTQAVLECQPAINSPTTTNKPSTSMTFTAVEDSCFSGNYVTEDVNDAYLLSIENSRGNNRRSHSASPHVNSSNNTNGGSSSSIINPNSQQGTNSVSINNSNNTNNHVQFVIPKPISSPNIAAMLLDVDENN